LKNAAFAIIIIGLAGIVSAGWHQLSRAPALSAVAIANYHIQSEQFDHQGLDRALLKVFPHAPPLLSIREVIWGFADGLYRRFAVATLHKISCYVRYRTVPLGCAAYCGDSWRTMRNTSRLNFRDPRVKYAA